MPSLASAAAPWRAQAVAGWHARSRREQWLLSILAAVLVTFVVIFLVIRPLQAVRAAALADIRTYDSLMIRLRTSAPVTSSIPRRTGDLSAIVTSSAAQFGIPIRTAPAPGARLGVQTDGIAYEAVVRWLANLRDTSNVRIVHIALSGAATGGAVNVAMMVTQ